MQKRFKVLSMIHTCTAHAGEATDHLLVEEHTTIDDIMAHNGQLEIPEVIFAIFREIEFANDVAEMLNARSMN